MNSVQEIVNKLEREDWSNLARNLVLTSPAVKDRIEENEHEKYNVGNESTDCGTCEARV